MNKVVSFKPEYGTYQPDDGGKVLDICPFCAAAPHLEQDQDETWYVACIKKIRTSILTPFLMEGSAVIFKCLIFKYNLRGNCMFTRKYKYHIKGEGAEFVRKGIIKLPEPAHIG